VPSTHYDVAPQKPKTERPHFVMPLLLYRDVSHNTLMRLTVQNGTDGMNGWPVPSVVVEE
ncbi:MAG: hypothetical protein QGF59_04060, partial [Pirellulaceae bacterium]|nr:hypothetical protein [Pirellulaceae bacterium]